MSAFSKQQLYQLRNQIPIKTLINDTLGVTSIFNGVWRFQCPVCHQFNTATKQKTNLARCFDCQKNFNTIDMVIYVKKLDFKDSIHFLLPLLDKFNQPVQQQDKKVQDIKPMTFKKVDPEKVMQEIKKIKQLLE